MSGELGQNVFQGQTERKLAILFDTNIVDNKTGVTQNRTTGKRMAAITSAVIAIAGVLLGWIAIEMACKPCLEKGRETIDRSLNPDYDPDDEIRAPLNADLVDDESNSNAAGDPATSADAIKSV